MIFYYFLSYCIIFYTHILLNLYICCFFLFTFKLPHSFDVLARFINIIWEYKSRSPGERSFMNCFSPTWFYWFQSVLFSLKPQIFSHVCCGSSVFKSLSNRTCRPRGGCGGSALPGRGFAVLTQEFWSISVRRIFKKLVFFFRHLCCWTTRASSHSRASAVFSCCSSLGRRRSFTILSGCKDVGLLIETPRFFLYKEKTH